ncbi:DUF2867 domain-containing protein [Paucibacter sp. APW11]|uniref:DUF2867 domain-containing protein n=1 Tax=Roseateles aquae TaxID=3077235 RepID=A0ABU3P7S5_9BURK|nr:DUF2867 domain-containing protein [Paucibacter sp. APW11]MDT8998627.1 DUF2867 domain-containing protein [Paucibacter sp. APW11]
MSSQPQTSAVIAPDAKPLKIAVPAQSCLAPSLATADFADSYLLPDPYPELGLLESWLRLMGRTPAWMDGLMWLRNRVVKVFGLKDLGGMAGSAAAARRRPAGDFKLGDRVGIFTLEAQHPQELVLGDRDRHLHVRVSLLRLQNADGSSRLALSTVVHEHNLLGRCYMALVGPVHSLIVPLLLRQLGRRLQAQPERRP